MRVLIFHGYLLRGTGSNVYNANLAGALADLGHEVHLFSQERDPGAAGVSRRGIVLHRPDIGRVLPVFVADRYEGFDAKPFLDCTDDEISSYIEANVAAVREVVARTRPDLALANHLIMGPVILARALGDDVPYAVKIHGSDIEYAVRRDPERFGPYAREGLARARTVLVGSLHTATALWETMDDAALPARTRLGPPGVELDRFGPRARAEAVQRVEALAERLRTAPPSTEQGSFARHPALAGRALAELAAVDGPIVLFVGKLILSKGIDLLVAAWPLVLARVPDAHLAVVGFGAYVAGLERLIDALAAGDLDTVCEMAREGRAAEGGPEGVLGMLRAFVDSLEGDERATYRAAAADLRARVTVVGRLDHDELAELLPLCDAQVVPSTFPEAYGMVAAEAAACGVLPISAAHSGLREVSRELAERVPAEARPLLSFPLGDRAVRDLADRIIAWIAAPEALREAVRTALVTTARERYSWDHVARSVVAAGEGRLDDLVPPS